MEPIYKYSDYRKYIQDYYAWMKSIKPSFAYRVLSTRAGINSSGFYPLIIQGKRDLTKATIEKTSRALELKENESEYFANLVQFNQAKTLRKKNDYFSKLLELLHNQNTRVISQSQYDVFSEWYHGVIRELVTCRDFKNDFRKLGNMLKPSITAKQARESVDLLLHLGLIKYENGNYTQSSPVIITGQDIKAHQVINYQVKMLKLAIEAFDRFKSDDQVSNSSTTFRISKETFELFKVKNRYHRQELLRLAEADSDADQVYQLNINMFPLSYQKHKGTLDE